MFDLSHVPRKAQVARFEGDGAWHAWPVPKAARFVAIWLLGGGGGGGGGRSNGVLAATLGSSGGGAGGLAVAMFRASRVEFDKVYINAPATANGGAAASDGSGGGIAYAALHAHTQAQNLLLVSSTAGAGGGKSVATGTAVGGLAATVGTVAACPLVQKALSYRFTAGVAAPDNNNSGVGPSASFGANLLVTGGAGGGIYNVSTYYAGGGITGVASTIYTLNNPGGTNAGEPAIGGGGLAPFAFYGGCGGGAKSGTGGRGGDAGAGFGCGGGGGGASAVGTGGAGGKGGPGLCLIKWW